MKTRLLFPTAAVLATIALGFFGCAKMERQPPTASAPPPVPTAAPPALDEGIYPVWFGTNRKPVTGPSGLAFGAEFAPRTSYGRADVFVPKTHRFGETGNPFWKRLLRGQLEDDHLVVRKLQPLAADAFYNEIKQAIQDAVQTGNESQALVFLHGFNVSFEEAAIRAAQVGFDLKVPGPTAFFSWPSIGSATLGAYRDDEKSIKASEAAIADFLVEFARESGATRINLIAHSMGNRGLLGALQRIAADAENRSKVKFNQIFLAAPDVGRDEFLAAAQVYASFSQRTTLYSSNGDLPVFLSSIIHNAPRAGFFKPYTVTAGVDTVAVPNFDVDMLGHSYFAQAEALLYDIRSLVLHNEAPPARLRVSALAEDGMELWQLRR